MEIVVAKRKVLLKFCNFTTPNSEEFLHNFNSAKKKIAVLRDFNVYYWRQWYKFCLNQKSNKK